MYNRYNYILGICQWSVHVSVTVWHTMMQPSFSISLLKEVGSSSTCVSSYFRVCYSQLTPDLTSKFAVVRPKQHNVRSDKFSTNYFLHSFLHSEHSLMQGRLPNLRTQLQNTYLKIPTLGYQLHIPTPRYLL